MIKNKIVQEGNELIRDEGEERIKKSLTSKNHETYIIEENGKEVAYFVLTLKRRVCVFNFLRVVRSAQGKGVGSFILKKAIALAGKNGCKKMRLAVWVKNHPAIALYNKFDFYAVDFERKAMKNKEDRLVMEKDL